MSTEPSDAYYGCCYKEKIYRHAYDSDAIIDEKGDTAIHFVYNVFLSEPSQLAVHCAVFTCDGANFYMAHSRGSRSSRFILANSDEVIFMCYIDCSYIVKGVSISNDTLYAIGEEEIFPTTNPGGGIWLMKYPLNDPHLEDCQRMDDLNRDVVGLMVIDNSFITWSNADKCMYRITPSTTGVQNVSQDVPAGSSTYDLLGRTVALPTRGIYIQNGRKVWVE